MKDAGKDFGIAMSLLTLVVQVEQNNFSRSNVQMTRDKKAITGAR